MLELQLKKASFFDNLFLTKGGAPPPSIGRGLLSLVRQDSPGTAKGAR